MKSIIFLFTLLFLFPSFAFAQSSIALSASSTGVGLGEDFTLDVTLTTTGSQVGDITIPGIESFDIFSTSQSQKFQSINGETQNEFLLQLQLTPKNLGEFQLGPVETKIGEENLTSNILTLQVGEKDISQVTSPTQNTISENMQIQDSSGETLEFRDELRAPQKTMNTFAKVFIVFLGLIVFIFLFFWILRKYLSRQTSDELEKIILSPKRDFKTEVEKYFAENNKLQKHDFFRGINSILREYLETKGVLGVKEKTLQELKDTKNISKEFTRIFEQSYRHEYDDLPENTNERENIKIEILNNID